MDLKVEEEEKEPEEEWGCVSVYGGSACSTAVAEGALRTRDPVLVSFGIRRITDKLPAAARDNHVLQGRKILVPR